MLTACGFFERMLAMNLSCVWEHNGPDTLLYAVYYPGAFARGASLEEAMAKMPSEIQRYCQWTNEEAPETIECVIVQEQPSSLMIRDADSDVLFEAEKEPLSRPEYERLKQLALKSAHDFQALYDAIPNRHLSCLKPRQTFYSQMPRTAQEMYLHTRNVNAYYFGEINVNADNEGGIAECRERGFALLEKQPDFLLAPVFNGSYGEEWTLRKVMRRFIWHDRIHARAMWRMALRTFKEDCIADPFFFG